MFVRSFKSLLAAWPVGRFVRKASNAASRRKTNLITKRKEEICVEDFKSPFLLVVAPACE